MKQFLLLIALLFIMLTPIHSLLLNKLTGLGSQGQKVCIHLVHSKILETRSLSFSPPQEMTALLCGENLKHSQEKTLYQSSGLIHLFVVSGSHFLVIERIAVFFKIPIFCRLIFFMFFLFFSGFQPPALRFVAQFLLFSTQLTWGNQFRSDQKTMFASFLVLVIFPDWITSFSFLLSWAASLAISCCSEIQNFFYQMIISQVLIFVVLFPILSQLQSPHLLSMAFNLILGGILSIVLLP
ncbi:MAG: ComEC/Rec2 family competence protein, partial [Pseudobdellovibrionaceae bacterium]